MAPKIYHIHPLVAGPLDEWGRHLARCRAMGFDTVDSAPLFAPGAAGDIFLTADHERLHPALGWHGSADDGIARLADACARQGLRLILDLVADRVATDAAIRAQQPDWFMADEPGSEAPDPRRKPPAPDTAEARFDQADPSHRLGDWWGERLARLARAGAGGFRCLNPHHVPPSAWQQIISTTRDASPGTLFIAWTPGVPRESIPQLAGLGFDCVASSLGWWDARASWLIEEAELLRHVAPSIASPEPGFTDRLASRLDPQIDLRIAYRRALRLAAATASGLFVPMGFEYATRRRFDPARAAPRDFEQARQEATIDLTTDIRQATEWVDRIAEFRPDGEMRALAGPEASVTALLRADAPDVRRAARAIVVLANPLLDRPAPIDIPLDQLPATAGAAFGRPARVNGELDLRSPLAPGDVRLLRYDRAPPVIQPWSRGTEGAVDAAAAPRIAIEAIGPAVDGGQFPVKRLAGDRVTVNADIFADGHELLAAELLWRAADETQWQHAPMRPVANDRWEATFAPARVGRHAFTIEAWWDEWGTLRRDLARKREAGQDVGVELHEAQTLLQRIRTHAPATVHQALDSAIHALDSEDPEQRAATVLAEATRAAVNASGDRPFASRARELPLDADRAQAAFASWYELFPRSATRNPARHGTFSDVVADLPRIRAMGFDVLYFPPIHPIGHTNRKGRNNSLRAQPDDLGSPYAIGSEEGGHDAILPELGTLEDFRRLIGAAQTQGLEVALDFAIQCSPDHPWLKQHPEWFRWRPDGSVRYAENPPKKYEDIVNVDFYTPASIPDLWLALRDVVLFWADQGIRIFRVDNPHTKPLPFWHWMIADVRARNPDLIFLAEAFTRPKVMYRLAKIGFTQSYTYFTWRNTKAEITAYLTELNAAPVSDFFRPNFFVNTPDINPVFLQTAGRAGFLIRAALATTLSGLWGMYSGFELCEAAPLPGREEYLDSEKYQLRVRDWHQPGNIAAEIAALNRVRCANPALQSHLGVRFYNAFNDQVILFGKMGTGHAAMILVAISFDPHHVQEADIEIPLWEWGLSDNASVAAEDLMRNHRFIWSGKRQRVRLDPNEMPFCIWRLTGPGAGR
ncbi:MAG TPA: maltotransferase domain-containing protein [Acetobacteraceae bacterium]